MSSAAPRPLRIVFADVPTLLGDLLASVLEGDPGCEIVGRLDVDGELDRVLASFDPDFVLLGLGEAERTTDSCMASMERRARPQLLGLDTREGTVAVYRLRPERQALGELSPQMLPAVLRECWSTGGGDL